MPFFDLPFESFSSRLKMGEVGYGIQSILFEPVMPLVLSLVIG